MPLLLLLGTGKMVGLGPYFIHLPFLRQGRIGDMQLKRKDCGRIFYNLNTTSAKKL